MVCDFHIDDTTHMLEVKVLGTDVVWGGRRQFRIPLDHVESIRVDPDIVDTKRGDFKVYGMGVGTEHKVGWFRHPKDGTNIFWDIHRPFGVDKVVVLELKDEGYAQLIVQVNDPDKCVSAVQKAKSLLLVQASKE